MDTINKAYPCISLAKEDFYDNDSFTKEQQAIIEKMSDPEMQSMADYIGEWLFDGDQWNMALESALVREPEQWLVIELGKRHPDFLVSIHRPVNETHPILHMYKDGYEMNTSIFLAENHWTLEILDHLAIKMEKAIEEKLATPPIRRTSEVLG